MNFNQYGLTFILADVEDRLYCFLLLLDYKLGRCRLPVHRLFIFKLSRLLEWELGEHDVTVFR